MGPGPGGGSLYGEVQYIMGNWTPHVNRLSDRPTPLKTLPFRNFVGGQEK